MRRILLLALLVSFAPFAYSADAPEYINDRAIRGNIEQQGRKLSDAGKTIENKILQERMKSDFTVDAVPPAEFTLTKDGDDLYDTVDDGVLVIARLYLCGKCDKLHANNASGFAISKDGLAVTNHHVMENKDENTQTFVAMTRSGKVYPIIEVLAASDKHDLALIQLDMGDEQLNPVPIARTAKVGDDVHVVSHPKGRFYEYSRGHIGRFLLSPRNKNTPRISVTSNYGGGSSGGPIFNDQGQVVAVVSEAEVVPDRKIVFYDAVPYQAILDLFKPEKQARE
ncbi:MAG: S1 family peptidase [Phycisphaeraceae bacterium]